jgi:hypothetical protein
MDPGYRLQTGHFVRREDHVSRTQRLTCPLPVIEIQDRSGALKQAGIAGEKPLLKEPGAQGVFVQSTPDRTIGSREAQFPSTFAHVENREARQRVTPIIGGALTGQGFEDDHFLRGENPAVSRTVGRLPTRNRA